MTTDSWYNLYGESWKGAIVDEAFCHPAKFSRALIRRIYEHAVEEGWLREGDTVVDPFGGVALGGLDAMHQGLRWCGVELEQKFVDLGNQNIELWDKTIGQHMRRWGSAVLLQGDSRRLGEVVRGGLDGAVTSPPYSTNAKCDYTCEQRDTEQQGQGCFRGFYGHTEGQMTKMPEGEYDAAVSSPSYNLPMSQDHSGRGGGDRGTTPAEPGAFARYGDTEGQLEGLPMGSVDAAISSPPFGAAETRNRSAFQDGEVASMMSRAYTQDRQGTTEGNLGMMNACVSSPPYTGDALGHDGACVWLDEAEDTRREKEGCARRAGYGTTEGQLGAMAGGFEGAISSPPFENCITGGNDGTIDRTAKLIQSRKNAGPLNKDYGTTEGQLGQEQAETFWSAARTIVEQVYALLKPGAHAIWVVKRFVRDKEIIDFPGQWQHLCEAVGFRVVHHHRAWLVEDRGTQYGLFGGKHEKTVARKSFFRRLYENKYPENSIDWEDVLCMVK